MKKYMALLLTVVLCLSIIACGGRETGAKDPVDQQTTASEQQKETEKTSAENVSENKGELHKVEITMDNWSDYFEFVIEEGMFADPTGAEHASIRYSVKLKDGVVISQTNWELITFEFSYHLEKRFYTVDENNTVVWEEAETTESQTDSREIPFGDAGAKSPHYVLSGNSWGKTAEGKTYAVVPVDFVVTNVLGNVYFD